MEIDKLTAIEIIKKVETRLATVSLRDDQIIEIRFTAQEYIVQIEDQLAMHNAVMELTNNGEQKYHVLVLPGQYGSITKEARERDVFEDGEYLGTKSITVAISSLPQRILGTLYFALMKKKVSIPYKLVRNTGAAMDWINALDK